MHIGLFFGSFNPIHTGHLVIANQLVEYTDMEQIWFVVSPQNPLKNKEGMLNEYDRLYMVEQAIEDNFLFRANNIEFSLPKPSYTVDTLLQLSEKFTMHTFSLIMGADNLSTLHKWKNYETILKHYQVYVYKRPGFPAPQAPENFLKSVRIVEFPQLDVSASYIRKSVKEGISIKYLVPEKVREYIETMNLYK
ncbi:nicotinate (nicotinamide) nucleotide adenylyltransferase [soil metagenome]